MPHYCILASGYSGHLYPIVVLGRELLRRGHRITVVAPLDAQPIVREAGLDFHPIATLELPEGEWNRATAMVGEICGFPALRSAGHLLGRFAKGILRDLPEIAATHKFDGLLMDQIAFGTECVCQKISLPMAVACCAIAFHLESRVPSSIYSWRYNPSLPFRIRNQFGWMLANSTGWPLAMQLVPYRLKHRLGSMGFYYVNELKPSLVQVAQQPSFFDFPRQCLPNHFHYTAPWIESGSRAEPDFPWDRLDGRPLIYASLGTLQNRLPHVFRLIAEACSSLNVQLVMALGQKGALAPESLPGNPIVVDFAPQLALLKRASLVITHGGLNTTLESLSHGIPLVVIPIANDQPGIAARVAHLGLGEFIPVKKLTGPSLRAVVQKVLTAPKYRQTAERFADKVKALNGPSLAVDLIEAAFHTRQRMTLAPKTSNAYI